MQRTLARRAHRTPDRDADCAQCMGKRQCWPGHELPLPSIKVHRQPALGIGTVLWRQGDAYIDPAIVRSGCVKVMRTDADGSSRVLSFALPGDMIGLESLHSPRHATTAIVIDPAWVCSVRWQAVSATERARLQGPLLAHAARQLGDERTYSRPGDPRAAVLQFMRALGQRIGELKTDDRGANAIALRLPMSRAEIGQHLGMAEETVCRALKQLVGDAHLQVRARQVVLHDRFRHPVAT